MIRVLAINSDERADTGIRHLYSNCPKISSTPVGYVPWVGHEDLQFDDRRVEFTDRKICADCKLTFVRMAGSLS